MIPINDLKRAANEDLSKIDSAVKRVLKSGWFILGPELEAFEEEFARYLGGGFAIGVGNGTDALEISLTALGIKPGDLVATTANCGGYSTTAIMKIGAVPIYIDVELETGLMSVTSLESVMISYRNLKCVIVTHLYGNAANIELIHETTEKYNVNLVEDCAQAIGAEVSGIKVGNFGEISTFSFFPTKNLGALGDAGGLFTKRRDLAEKIKKLRQYGWSRKYYSEIEHGQNSRMDEIQAAILRFRLEQLDQLNSKRRKILAGFKDSIKTSNVNALWFLDSRSVGHLAVLSVENREEVQKILLEDQIMSEVHYPLLDSQQPAWLAKNCDLTNSEMLVQKIITIPCFPQLTESEVHRIQNSISKF